MRNRAWESKLAGIVTFLALNVEIPLFLPFRKQFLEIADYHGVPK